MFGSTILETAMGLIFVFLVFGLICSGFREWIAMVLNTRAKTLKKGILNLLRDEGMTAQIFNHHLVRVKDKSGRGEKSPAPTHIPCEVFSEALLDSILNVQMIEEIKESIDKIENALVKKTLTDLLDSAGKNLEEWNMKHKNAKRVIEDWFNRGMEVSSTWYKRQTHRVLLGLAVVFCILFNVDSIQIIRSLSVNPALRESITAMAIETAKRPVDSTSVDSFNQGKELQEQIRQLGLPIGWAKTAGNNPDDPRGVPLDVWAWFYKVLGLLMSILAISMGAPFWFDILKKIVNLSGALKRYEPPPVPAPTATAASSTPLI